MDYRSARVLSEMCAVRGSKAGAEVTTNQMATALSSLCRFAVEFSPYTGLWWVHAPLSISNTKFLTGFAEHEETPELAVQRYWARATNLKADEHLHMFRGEQPEWRGRWNGFMWEEFIVERMPR